MTQEQAALMRQPLSLVVVSFMVSGEPVGRAFWSQGGGISGEGESRMGGGRLVPGVGGLAVASSP